MLYGGLKLADRRSLAPNGLPAGPLGPGLSVIIPERANPVPLGQCLDTVRTATGDLPEPWEVIVVVNGWPKRCYRDLVSEHTEVRWIFSEKPLWFSGAIRRGLQAARYDWVYLLNNDMVVDPLAFFSLLYWRSPRVFGIASQIYFRDAERRREETGWTMFRESDGVFEIRDEVADDETTVRGTFYAGGGASLFQRHLLMQLLRQSSVYLPFYWEDVEWGTRAWRRGYRSLYCPASKVWHGHRQTNRKFFSEVEIDRILNRNRLVFQLRNGPSPDSLQQLREMLARLDPKSQAEILTPGRVARIVSGRAAHLPLAPVWEQQYGCIEDRVIICDGDEPGGLARGFERAGSGYISPIP